MSTKLSKKTFRNTNIVALVKIKGSFYPLTDADMRGVGQIIVEDIEGGGDIRGVPAALSGERIYIDALKSRYDKSDSNDIVDALVGS